jgi:hypothetical protein
MERNRGAKAEPDNVIALSRYRARLGRGKRLRRADALLAGPDPERAIRALPGDEFYYVVHEVGLRDAGDILACAKPEQVQAALDFALWERDQVAPERLAEWVSALAEAPPDRIAAWLAGLDVELVALLLRKTSRIYDLTLEEAPDEPEGMAYATPDGFFVLDVRGDDDEGGEARAMVRLIDSLYRADKGLARRILVGARGEMDSELEELAYRWRQGRMADLGFSEYYEALEVYRELDPSGVHIGEVEPGKLRVRTVEVAETGDGADGPARMPTALMERVGGGATPFSRAAQALTAPDEVADLHFALVALTNRVLAADRVAPGNDKTVRAVLDRMAATLDLAVEFLARGDAALEREAVRTIPLVRIFQLGVTLIGKVKRLALTLRRRGPFAAARRDLGEPQDAPILEAVTAVRPMFPGVLDDPPTAAERPFRSLHDLARATAAIERVAAAQTMLRALGVRPEDVAPGSAALAAADLDDAALDIGVLARTALVRRLLARGAGRRSSSAPDPSMPFEPLDPREVREFEALLDVTPEGPMKLPETLKKKAKAVLDGLSPGRLAGAAAEVADRWIAGLAPLEPVLVRRPPKRPRKR